MVLGRSAFALLVYVLGRSAVAPRIYVLGRRVERAGFSVASWSVRSPALSGFHFILST